MGDKASLQNLKLSNRMQFLLFPERCDNQARVWMLQKWRDVDRYGKLTRAWKNDIYMLYGNYDIRNCQILAIRSLGSDRNYGIKNLCPLNKFLLFCFCIFSYFDKDWWTIAKPTSGYIAITTVAHLEIQHIPISGPHHYCYEPDSQVTIA